MELPETKRVRNAAALRRIPSIESLLSRPLLEEAARRLGRRRVVAATRAAISELRNALLDGGLVLPSLEELENEIAAAAAKEPTYSLRPVINATGVILHTNLGRSPLAEEAAHHVLSVATSYSNLEYDLARGERGRRDVHVERLFEALLGVAPALVVNNNAAAVFIALNTLAEGAEVIVSRGELVEIGGSFRIPDVCAKSGAVLREVGTTNRTRAGDYAAAITERTRMLLRVHPSNFRIEGFTERPQLEDLAALAHERGLILMEDLGSGSLAPLDSAGTRDEPDVASSLNARVDVLTFSGDKLLGGPQAGVILGKRDLLGPIRKNPLFRAFRPGKLTLAALEATLSLYMRDGSESIPPLHMINTTKEQIAVRARALASQLARFSALTVTLEDGMSVAGGGSTPGRGIPTVLVALAPARSSARDLATSLRQNDPPIITRVEDDRVVLDLRTVLDKEQEAEIVRALEILSQ